MDTLEESYDLAKTPTTFTTQENVKKKVTVRQIVEYTGVSYHLNIKN